MYAGGLMYDVSTAEALQRSGLSTSDDILRHRRLPLFGHVARLDHGVPAHDALRLMVDTYEGRKPMSAGEDRRPPGRPRNVWLNKFRRMPTLYCYLRCGDLRSPWVTQRRNCSLGLRDDDDDDDGDDDDDDDEGCKTCVKNGG